MYKMGNGLKGGKEGKVHLSSVCSLMENAPIGFSVELEYAEEYDVIIIILSIKSRITTPAAPPGKACFPP